MQTPLRISYRDVGSSEAIEDRVRQHVDKLEHVFPRLTSCHVVIEAPHRHQQQGKLYHIVVHLIVPGGEIVVGREPHQHHAHEDIYVALRDSFDAARRQLEDHARLRGGQVKSHETPPHGRIVRLLAAEGYGFIATPDGREVYFHRNSVVNGDFDKLEEGTEVRFSEEIGEKGPQATTVHIIGKHHLV